MTLMNNEQVQILWSAAQDAGLTKDQMRGLSIANPYALSGPVAERMRASVSRIAPAQAQEWIAEAGAQMSLQARAASLGMTDMTVDLQAEINAFTPVTPEQATYNRIEELKASLPYGSQGHYLEDGSFVPGTKGNFTLQMELQALAPDVAANMKAAAQPPVANTGLSEEAAARINSQLRSGQF